MSTTRSGAMAYVLPLLLFASFTTNAQERYWEVLSLFGGDGSNTYPSAFLHDPKRDRFIIVGNTEEVDLPVTADAIKPRLTDMMDGFIAVFNGDCSELIYCSYIGGSKNDAIVDAILLDENRMLIAGGGYSDDLPTTGTAWLETAPGDGDGWLAVVSLESFEILQAGYFGGSGKDGVTRAKRLADGSVMITGQSTSSDLPTTPNAFQSKNNSISGYRDAYIAIFDSTLQLTFCSYHGGRIGDGEDAWKGLVETEHYIVFTGTVLSPDLPITEDAYQNTYGGGVLDAYLTVISKDSLKRVYSTYLGGDGDDHIADLVSLGADRIMLVGTTESLDFPVTPNAWQTASADTTLPWERGEIVLGVFSIADKRFEQLSYMGGENTEFAKTAVYDSGNRQVLILGVSVSNEFPFVPAKPPDCEIRGVLIRFDPDLLVPSGAQPVVDIARSIFDQMILVRNRQIAFCGVAYSFYEAGPVPVRQTGFKTIRTGSSDIMIGLVRDTPVSVVALVDASPGGAGLEIHPQPACDQLRFDFEGMDGGTATLYDLLGRKSAEAQLGSNGGMVRGMMDLGAVKPGMYILVVRTADVVRTGKVVVTK